MKKLGFLILTTMAIFGFQVNANSFIGGHVYLRLQTSDANTNSSFTLNPEFGTFLNDDLAVGGILDLSVNKSKNKNSDVESTNRTFGLGGFAKYFLGEGTNNIRFYVQGNGILGFNKNKIVNVTTVEATSTDLDLYLNPAVQMKLTEKLALDITVGYAGFDFTFQDAGNEIGMRISINSIGFGLTYDL